MNRPSCREVRTHLKKKENEVRKRGKGPFLCFKNYCEGRTDRRRTDTSINLRKEGETDGHIRIVFRSFQAIARWKKWTKGGFNAQKKKVLKFSYRSC